MQYTIKNVTIRQQLQGIGVPVSTVTIALDWSAYVVSPLSDQFILRMQFDFENRTYYFTNIYKLSDISADKTLESGTFTLLGLYTSPSDLSHMQVSITYLGGMAS